MEAQASCQEEPGSRCTSAPVRRTELSCSGWKAEVWRSAAAREERRSVRASLDTRRSDQAKFCHRSSQAGSVPVATPTVSAPPWLSCRAIWPMAQSLHPTSVHPPPTQNTEPPSEPSWGISGAKYDSTSKRFGATYRCGVILCHQTVNRIRQAPQWPSTCLLEADGGILRQSLTLGANRRRSAPPVLRRSTTGRNTADPQWYLARRQQASTKEPPRQRAAEHSV